MNHITVTEFRSKLRTILDRVNADREPVAIRRSGGREVVVLDADDYASLIETLHLVRNPANAERLRKGMNQHRAGQRQEIDVTPYLD